MIFCGANQHRVRIGTAVAVGSAVSAARSMMTGAA